MTGKDKVTVVKRKPKIYISCGRCKSRSESIKPCCCCSGNKKKEKDGSGTNIFLNHMSEYLHKISQRNPKPKVTTFSVEKEDEFEYSKELRNVKLKCAPNCFGIKARNSGTITGDTIVEQNKEHVINKPNLQNINENKCLHVNISFVNHVNLPGSECCNCNKKGLKRDSVCTCNWELQDDIFQKQYSDGGREGDGAQYCVVISPEGETTIFYKTHDEKVGKKKKLDKDRIIKSESEESDEEEKESSDEDDKGGIDTIHDGVKEREGYDKSEEIGEDGERRSSEAIKESLKSDKKEDSQNKEETGEKGSKASDKLSVKKEPRDSISNTVKADEGAVSVKEKDITDEKKRLSEKEQEQIDDLGRESETIDKQFSGSLQKLSEEVESPEGKDERYKSDEKGDRLTGEGEVTGEEQEGKETGKGQEGKVVGEEQEGEITGKRQESVVTGEGQEGEVTVEGQEGEVTGEGQEGEVTGEGQEGEVSGEGQEGEVLAESVELRSSDEVRKSQEGKLDSQQETAADSTSGSKKSLSDGKASDVHSSISRLSEGRASAVYSLAVQSIESAKKNWTKDTEYLEKQVGSYLIKSVAEIGFVKPSGPVNYLGERLYKYRHMEDLTIISDAEKEDALFRKEMYKISEQKIQTFNTLKKHRYKEEVVSEVPTENGEKVEGLLESDLTKEIDDENPVVGMENTAENDNVVSEEVNAEVIDVNKSF